MLAAHARGVAFFLLASVLVLGQSPTGSIEGTVTDPSGAVIIDAKVTVTEQATDRTIMLVSGVNGSFVVRNLIPGLYRVKAEAPGFSIKEIKDIRVDSGSAVNASVKLDVGKTGDVVEVAAAAVAVDTTRQTVDTVITGQQITDLPLFSRNFLDLAALAPGVIVRSGESIDPTKTFAYRTVGIDGHSGTGTRIQIDGVDVTDETVGTTVANISNEAVSQFQLTRSSLDISTSLTSSGAVNIITKGGANDPHASWFYDYFNQDMAARLQYQPTVTPFDRKRTGGSVGWRFIKDKLFWFANYEKTWQTTQSIANVGFPFASYSALQGFATNVRYISGRLDWNVTPSTRAFYRFNHDDNLSTGGGALSPYQNIDNTNVHAVGLDFAKAHATNSVRIGYTNFNNKINSQELDVKFLRGADGTPVNLSVGPLTYGPNGLAPQATYQDNTQISYDGSYVWNKHTFRYGFSYTRVKLGGFANFAGPLSVGGTYDSGTLAALQASGANVNDPLNYPFSSFSMGPANGFFTLMACDNLPHGCHFNHRTAGYVGDSIRLARNFTINLGLRIEYDSGYFNNDKSVTRDPILETWGKGFSTFPEQPTLVNPSVGFAWDPKGNGKWSIRGGFYRSYEMNIFNNLIFDEFVQLPPGIGPDSYGTTSVTGPDGTPLNVDGKHPTGNYSDLAGQPIRTVLPTIVALNAALQKAYANYKFDPKVGQSDLRILKQDFDGVQPGNQFHAPYAIQANIGVQHELRPGTVISVDYIFNHGVGMPFLLRDFEMRHDASTLNATAAQAQVNSVLKGLTVDQYIAANPTRGINAFSLGGDAIFTGISPNFNFMRFLQGGFTKYQALQVELRGRVKKDAFGVKDLSYTVGYSRGLTQATNGASRAEFLSSVQDNHRYNSGQVVGPTALDFRHILNASANMRIPGGVELNSIWSFRTASPQSLTIPNLGAFTSSSNGIFSTDINGDGGTGTGSPRSDVLPGVNVGQFGRDIGSLDQLNQVITNFNSNYAGKLTPAAQALVNAGIFTQAQMIKLGAVIPSIPLVPAGNPNPWHNLFTTDLRVTRPVRIKERFRISPFADIINLFNHAPRATYGGLGTTFGSLNFNYAAAAPGQQVPDFNFARGRLNGLRQVQVGIRLDF